MNVNLTTITVMVPDRAKSSLYGYQIITQTYHINKKVKGKEYGVRLYSPYRRCWSPFLGPSARKCNGGVGANHPVLSHTLPVYLPQISPGTNLELGQLWLSLQSHTTDPHPKLINWVYWNLNLHPLRRRILNPAHQSTWPGWLQHHINMSH